MCQPVALHSYLCLPHFLYIIIIFSYSSLLSFTLILIPITLSCFSFHNFLLLIPNIILCFSFLISFSASHSSYHYLLLDPITISSFSCTLSFLLFSFDFLYVLSFDFLFLFLFFRRSCTNEIAITNVNKKVGKVMISCILTSLYML